MYFLIKTFFLKNNLYSYIQILTLILINLIFTRKIRKFENIEAEIIKNKYGTF